MDRVEGEAVGAGLRKWRWPRYWNAAISGALVVACFPPFRLSLLVFIALVPWLLYLRDCDGKRAFRSGLLFGFIFWLGEFSFVASFVGHWTHSLALGFVPYLLGCALGSLYFALFGWLTHLCYRGRIPIPWVIPITWAGVEVFRSYIVGLAFPFGLLAMPLTWAPAITQTAHYGSVYFSSAWVVLANVILAEAVAISHGRPARVAEGVGRVGGLESGQKSPFSSTIWSDAFRRIRWFASAFLLLLMVSLLRYSASPPGVPRQVVAGQLGIDLAFSDPSTVGQLISEAVGQIGAEGKGADLLVLPEGIAHANVLPPHPLPFAVDPTLPVIFGGQRGESPAYQSAFAYDGQWKFADKTRLVIFGEYVPFRDHLPFMESFNLPGGDLRPAETLTTLTVGKLRVGASLCFEALFPDVSYRHALNGANILAVMSIDDWYFGTNAPEQLRDASVWRAIETGLPVVRSAPLGHTAIFDARGRTVAEAPLYRTQALRATVTVPAGPDLFPLLPVFPYVALLSLVLVPIYRRVWG